MDQFEQYFLNVIRERYSDFEGRARRKEYWMFQLFGFLVAIGIMIVMGILGVISESLAMIGGLAYIVFALGIIVPSLAVSIRRLHDTGRSGWFLLIGLIPLGGLVVFYFMIIEGDQGPNEYGEDPKNPYGAMRDIEDFEDVLN